MSDPLRVGGELLSVEVSPLGARITSIRFRTLAGWRELTVGLASDADYLASADYQGATVGRFANRVARGELPLEGTTHRLGTNDRGHTLHGGPEGFDRRVWDVVEAGPGRVVLDLVSPDGDQGFPGTLRVRAVLEVEGARLRTDFRAECDAPTHVSLTSHPYFALAEEVVDHRLQVAARVYLPTDGTGIPTGARPVGGTGFDLREPAPVDRAFDHCWVLDGSGMRRVAELAGGGLRLTLGTDQPGLQVYAGGGRVEGVALEPQHLPDSPHHPEWPTTVLRPGETYHWRSEIAVEEQ